MEKGLSILRSDSRESVKYMVREITYICKNMRSRAPGSEGEREAAEYMAAFLKKACGWGKVVVETFKEHPNVFFSYFYFSIERLNREIRRRICVVGSFPEGNYALMLVCGRLRHVAGTQWGNNKYMNMKHLEMTAEGTYFVA